MTAETWGKKTEGTLEFESASYRKKHVSCDEIFSTLQARDNYMPSPDSSPSRPPVLSNTNVAKRLKLSISTTWTGSATPTILIQRSALQIRSGLRRRSIITVLLFLVVHDHERAQPRLHKAACGQVTTTPGSKGRDSEDNFGAPMAMSRGGGYTVHVAPRSNRYGHASTHCTRWLDRSS